MFYKKESEDENIISGIDEDFGESDVDMAMEPIQKPKAKLAIETDKKKEAPKKKDDKPAAPPKSDKEDVKNITNIFYQDKKPITVFNNI